MTNLQHIDNVRSLLGFDDLFEKFGKQVNNSNYPPYNVIKHNEEHYEIQVAVTGFEKEDVSVEVVQNELVVKGVRSKKLDEQTYIYHGLAARQFTRVWTLAADVHVEDAEIKNGILTIKLQRITPEALKPRKLAIK